VKGGVRKSNPSDNPLQHAAEETAARTGWSLGKSWTELGGVGAKREHTGSEDGDIDHGSLKNSLKDVPCVLTVWKFDPQSSPGMAQRKEGHVLPAPERDNTEGTSAEEGTMRQTVRR